MSTATVYKMIIYLQFSTRFVKFNKLRSSLVHLFNIAERYEGGEWNQ